ncbi:MAG: helix-turn-helix transcriptional regulator [Myxococcales bacterium]|nr:helix-turn-helix transcriptional regulator [Myxococcales bacterium]
MGRRPKEPPRRAPEIAPPPGLRAARFALGGRDVAVLSFPTDQLRIPESLSPAERDVTLALVHGATNAEIAERRGVAVRTVANQVASIFKKLGVSSRTELAAKLGSTRKKR